MFWVRRYGQSNTTGIFEQKSHLYDVVDVTIDSRLVAMEASSFSTEYLSALSAGRGFDGEGREGPRHHTHTDKPVFSIRKHRSIPPV